MCYKNCQFENRDGDCRLSEGRRKCPEEENAQSEHDTENSEEVETA